MTTVCLYKTRALFKVFKTLKNLNHVFLPSITQSYCNVLYSTTDLRDQLSYSAYPAAYLYGARVLSKQYQQENVTRYTINMTTL